MRTRIYIAAVIALGFLAGCVKQSVSEGTDMHEFTQAELKKKQVDDAFASFFAALKLDTVHDPAQEVWKNSRVTIPMFGVVRYTYVKDGVTVIVLDARMGSFKADLYGGIHLEGDNLMDGGTAVFINNQQVATIGYVVYDGILTPVFRFDDGTTYAITGVLLVEPLIDYLLKYVLSTE